MNEEAARQLYYIFNLLAHQYELPKLPNDRRTRETTSKRRTRDKSFNILACSEPVDDNIVITISGMSQSVNSLVYVVDVSKSRSQHRFGVILRHTL